MLNSIAGYKTYFTAACMLAYAAAAFFVLPPPYHLDPDSAIKIVFAAMSLVGLRSGMTTEITKLLAGFGVDVSGDVSTPAAVQSQGSKLVRALATIAWPIQKNGVLVKTILFMLIATSMLSMYACAGLVVPKTPSQIVYDAKAGFASALVIADGYAALPTCPTATPICKTADVLAVVKKAAHTAQDALDAADGVVNDPQWAGDKAAAAADAAQSAEAAFEKITADLKTK